jgi:hypothetical protein
VKTKRIMSELDNLCDFVLQSSSIYDFNVRFNFLLSMAVNSFEDEISKKNHLPFNSHIFIETLNNKINSIIGKINKSNIFFEDGELMSDIFILILKEDFPEQYKNYLYQFEYRNN